MEKKTKQLIFFTGSIFVAVIFLTSYAAFGSNGGPNTTTSTVKPQTTFFATGSSNAVIYNYSSIAYIPSASLSNASVNSITSELSNLQANGSVEEYIYINGSYQVILSGMSPYMLRQQLYGISNMSNSLEVGATTYISLPGIVTLYYNKVPAALNLAQRNYSIYMDDVMAQGTTINVSISALLSANGSIYDNQFRVGYSGS
ncbi:MAG: hypothetical protein ACREBH_04080 [Candidatus Micrarchaeaceae archaeon]